jgi:hypothetical protein
MKTRPETPSTSLTRSAGTLLTAEQFRRLADVPAALEWLANIPNARTRRNYERHATEFARFVGIKRPDQFRDVTRAHVIEFRRRIERDGNNNNDDANIDVTDPTANDDVDRGDTQRIAWRVTDEPSNSSVILDLYTKNNRLVGTIAIKDGEDGSYNWRVPTPNTYCTQQYPNGLCGHDLEGDYYIKARLVQGNGFNSGIIYDTDDSGVFTIRD